MLLDRMIIEFDQGLRTLLMPARSQRPHPDQGQAEAPLSPREQKHAAGLMRVNHVGEICAQALYQGQALTARNADTRTALRQAAQEEEEHLAWTAQRVHELGSHTSHLNPLWYSGAWVIGVGAGLLGDRWNLGFLAETEHQVVAHLEQHLGQLPAQDGKSRAIVQQMRDDEARHADMAIAHGAATLPAPVKFWMRCNAKIMTTLSYYL